VFLGDPDNRVDSGDFEDWTPEIGRVGFSIETAQLHHHPEPLDFLKECLAMIVWFWEQDYSAKHTYSVRLKGGTRVFKHDPSPYTSLDVQRFALMTLDQNPSISITDLLGAAQQDDLVAPTRKHFLQVLEDAWLTGELTGREACQLGLHDLATEGILAGLPKPVQGADEPSSSAPRAKRSAYSLSKSFHERISSLEPLGGNKRALSSQLKKWMNDGVSDEVVLLMTDEFVQHLRSYCPEGSVPWKIFIAKRHTLMKIVERHWSDQYGWGKEAEQEHNRLFGRSEKE